MLLAIDSTSQWSCTEGMNTILAKAVLPFGVLEAAKVKIIIQHFGKYAQDGWIPRSHSLTLSPAAG